MYLCVVFVPVGLRALLSCREIVGASMGSFISEIMSLNLFVPQHSSSFPLLFLSFSSSLSLFRPWLFSPLLPVHPPLHSTPLPLLRSKREDGGVGRLNIPLVADTSKKISASYGVLVTDESDDMYGAGTSRSRVIFFLL